MTKDKEQTVGGFQVSVVDEVPEEAALARGVYAELIEKVPPEGKALKIDYGEAKRASTRVSGLRGFLKRHELLAEYTVVRRGSEVFIARATKKS